MLGGAPSGERRKTLTIPLRAHLPDGDYSVRWSIISDDGHLESGVLAFAVGEGRAPPTAGPRGRGNGAWHGHDVRALALPRRRARGRRASRCTRSSSCAKPTRRIAIIARHRRRSPLRRERRRRRTASASTCATAPAWPPGSFVAGLVAVGAIVALRPGAAIWRSGSPSSRRSPATRSTPASRRSTSSFDVAPRARRVGVGRASCSASSSSDARAAAAALLAIGRCRPARDHRSASRGVRADGVLAALDDLVRSGDPRQDGLAARGARARLAAPGARAAARDPRARVRRGDRRSRGRRARRAQARTERTSPQSPRSRMRRSPPRRRLRRPPVPSCSRGRQGSSALRSRWSREDHRRRPVAGGRRHERPDGRDPPVGRGRSPCGSGCYSAASPAARRSRCRIDGLRTDADGATSTCLRRRPRPATALAKRDRRVPRRCAGVTYRERLAAKPDGRHRRALAARAAEPPRRTAIAGGARRHRDRRPPLGPRVTARDDGCESSQTRRCPSRTTQWQCATNAHVHRRGRRRRRRSRSPIRRVRRVLHRHVRPADVASARHAHDRGRSHFMTDPTWASTDRGRFARPVERAPLSSSRKMY